MGSKTILKKTSFGNILARRPGESNISLIKRQDTEFKKKRKRGLF